MDRIGALITAMGDLGVPLVVAENLAGVAAFYAKDLQSAAQEQAPQWPAGATLVQLATKLHRHLLKRADLLGDLAHGPAWNMLVSLLISLEEQRAGLQVSSLCAQSGAPPTTALRYIAALIERGLVFKTDDVRDGRRVWVNLTERGRVGVTEMLKSLLQPGPTRSTIAAPAVFLD